MALDTQVRSTDYFRDADGCIIIKEGSPDPSSANVMAIPAVALMDENKLHLGGANPVSISVDGTSEIVQDTHDDLNANVNLQVGDADVESGNPVPVNLEGNISNFLGGLLSDLIKETKKTNLQLAIITDNFITDKDVEGGEC